MLLLRSGEGLFLRSLPLLCLCLCFGFGLGLGLVGWLVVVGLWEWLVIKVCLMPWCLVQSWGSNSLVGWKKKFAPLLWLLACSQEQRANCWLTYSEYIKLLNCTGDVFIIVGFSILVSQHSRNFS